MDRVHDTCLISPLEGFGDKISFIFTSKEISKYITSLLQNVIFCVKSKKLYLRSPKELKSSRIMQMSIN